MAKILLLDLETAPHPDGAKWARTPLAAGNLKDPAKIAADLAAKSAALTDKMALDWNTNQIVALGMWEAGHDEPSVFTADEHPERAFLEMFGEAWAEHDQILGFMVRQFDLPVLIQHCRYAGIKPPAIDLNRWNSRHVIDLYDILTFHQLRPSGDAVMSQSLESFCRRFGIEVADTADGADVPGLVTAGAWETIAGHCCADLYRLKALAERLGYLHPPDTELCAVVPAVGLSEPF